MFPYSAFTGAVLLIVCLVGHPWLYASSPTQAAQPAAGFSMLLEIVFYPRGPAKAETRGTLAVYQRSDGSWVSVSTRPLPGQSGAVSSFKHGRDGGPCARSLNELRADPRFSHEEVVLGRHTVVLVEQRGERVTSTYCAAGISLPIQQTQHTPSGAVVVQPVRISTTEPDADLFKSFVQLAEEQPGFVVEFR